MNKRPQALACQVTVLKDINQFFGSAGCTRYVRGDSAVLGTVKLAADEEVRDNCANTSLAHEGDIVGNDYPGTTITATKIFTQDFGELLILETPLEFENLAGMCCQPS